MYLVVEWVGRKQGTRKMLIMMDTARKRITLHENHALVRMIDLSKVDSNESVELIFSTDVFNLLIRIPKDHDLVNYWFHNLDVSVRAIQ